MKLKVKRNFILAGQPVEAGAVIEVEGGMAAYLLGLQKPPVEMVPEAKPASKRVSVTEAQADESGITDRGSD